MSMTMNKIGNDNNNYKMSHIRNIFKALCLTSVLCLAVTPIDAQTVEPPTRHEIAIGTGNSITPMLISSLLRSDCDCGDFHARRSLRIPLSVHYLYRTSEKWAFGGTFHYEPVERKEFYFSLMPQAKWRWFNRKYMSMYSRVAVGVMYRNALVNSDRFYPAFQLSPFGIDAGTEHLHAYADIGAGMQNIVQLGIKYEF